MSSGASLQGKIWIDTSTVHPDTTATCASRLAEVGSAFVASPVFGASPVAAAGKLIFAMAGPREAVETLRPFIADVMAKSIMYLGEDVRKGSLLKITGYVFACYPCPYHRQPGNNRSWTNIYTHVGWFLTVISSSLDSKNS